MPDPADPVAAEEEVKEQEVVAADPEKGAEADEKPVAETTDPKDGADEPEGKEVDETERKISEAVGKALAAQSAKLGEARKAVEDRARIEAENRIYKEELDRLRNPKVEPKPEEELTLPDGMDLLPKAAQDDYMRQKRLLAELSKRDAVREQSLARIQRDTIAREIDGTVEDMKADADAYPGFAEVYPQIEEMGRTDPDFLRAVVANPKKWLRLAYRDLTAENAPALAEKALEAKLAKQHRAQTSKPGLRDNGGSAKRVGIDAILEKAWSDAGGGGEE